MDDDGWKIRAAVCRQAQDQLSSHDRSEVVSQQFGNIDSLPTSFVLDRQGRIAANHVGLVEKKEYIRMRLSNFSKTLRPLLWITLALASSPALWAAGVRAGQRP